MGDSDRVRAACEASYSAHENDCSGFVKAVSAQLGVELTGLANDIVNTIAAGENWVVVHGGVAAAAAAAQGLLVLGGLLGELQADPSAHGHVVVIVAGPQLAFGKYPMAYWGSDGEPPGRNQTINWAWTAADRDKVTYASTKILGSSGAGERAVTNGDTAIGCNSGR